MAIEYKTEGRLVLDGSSTIDPVVILFVQGSNCVTMRSGNETIKLSKTQLTELNKEISQLLAGLA